MISFMLVDDSTSETFSVPDPIATSCSANPMEVTTSVVLFAGTLIEKLPSAPVEVARLVPFTATVAPITGWLLAEVIFPVTVRWANAIVAKRRRQVVSHDLKTVSFAGISNRFVL